MDNSSNQPSTDGPDDIVGTCLDDAVHRPESSLVGAKPRMRSVLEEVAIRISANLLTAAVLWVFAIALGYVQRPENYLMDAALLVIGFATALGVLVRINENLERRGDKSWRMWLVAVGVFIVMIVAIKLMEFLTGQY